MFILFVFVASLLFCILVAALSPCLLLLSRCVTLLSLLLLMMMCSRGAVFFAGSMMDVLSLFCIIDGFFLFRYLCLKVGRQSIGQISPLSLFCFVAVLITWYSLLLLSHVEKSTCYCVVSQSWDSYHNPFQKQLV